VKIPKELKVGGHTIKIEQVKELAAMGYWISRENKIQLDQDLAPSQKQVTLLHEILHAINNELDHDKVELYAEAIYQVIVDNKLHFDGKDG